ncbi:MAG: hypothetical protein ABI861_04215 [Panacibacter sp.]
MKSSLFFYFLFFLFIKANSQKIFLDKNDPFTKTRTISTDLNSLYRVASTNILQVQSQIEIKNDTIITYRLNFITPALPVNIEVKDSLPNECMLNDDEGNIYNGRLHNETTAFLLGKNYQSYACSFSKDDFYKIVSINITDVKIISSSGKGGLFHIDKKAQDKISIQGKILLDKSKK